MNVAVLNQAGFTLHQRDIPHIGENEVLVKSSSCGVCEGDLFVYRTREAASVTDLVLGHEGTGTVTAVGSAVETFAVGDVVTALGGAYADYFVAKPGEIVKVPSTVDPQLALGEPLACCVHAGQRFGIQQGDRVAVLGLGFMGLICLQLAKHQGATTICAMDPVEHRREVAVTLGATATADPLKMSSAELLEEYGEFDVVIEAAGTQSALDACGDLVAQHGRIVLIGYHQSNNGQRTVDMKQWNFKAIDVVNGHVRREHEKLLAMQFAMEMMGNGVLTVEPLVKLYDLNDVSQAFKDLEDRKEGLFKAVLIPELK